MLCLGRSLERKTWGGLYTLCIRIKTIMTDDNRKLYLPDQIDITTNQVHILLPSEMPPSSLILLQPCTNLHLQIFGWILSSISGCVSNNDDPEW